MLVGMQQYVVGMHLTGVQWDGCKVSDLMLCWGIYSERMSKHTEFCTDKHHTRPDTLFQPIMTFNFILGYKFKQ